MGRRITKYEIAELGSLKLEDLLGVKGANTVVEVVNEAIEKGLRIGCIGQSCSGKTIIMRAILKSIGTFDESSTCDEVREVRDAKFMTSKACKFFVYRASAVDDMLKELLEMSGKSVAEPCIVIVCSVDNEGRRYISSVVEVSILDGKNVITELITIQKDKYHKVCGITI